MKVKEFKEILLRTLLSVLHENTCTGCPQCGTKMDYDDGCDCFICKACGYQGPNSLRCNGDLAPYPPKKGIK